MPVPFPTDSSTQAVFKLYLFLAGSSFVLETIFVSVSLGTRPSDPFKADSLSDLGTGSRGR